jgi:hypothetical protein
LTRRSTPFFPANADISLLSRQIFPIAAVPQFATLGIREMKPRPSIAALQGTHLDRVIGLGYLLNMRFNAAATSGG